MKITHLVIHHSATSPDASIEDIRSNHLARGFDDIGYHYLIAPNGRIFRGRGEGQEGAHARGINSHSIGLCCLGNFEGSDVPPEQFSALVVLAAEICARYSIQPENVIGHRDVARISSEATNTACPGEKLYALIDELRRRILLLNEVSPHSPLVEFFAKDADIVTVLGSLPRSSLSRVKSVPSSQGALQIRVALIEEQSFTSLSETGDVLPESIWENTLQLMGDPSNPDKLIFTAYVPQACLPCSRYIFVVTPQLPDEEVDELFSNPLFVHGIVLPIEQTYSLSIPPYRAQVVVSRLEETGPFLVRLVGRVMNTGTDDWINSDELSPFRIGAIVVDVAQRGAPILELRYDIARKAIRRGEELPFSFTFDISEFPPGEYFAHVDIVRERRFWFTELGCSRGDSIQFSVEERTRVPRSTTDHLLNPPSSGVATPQRASLLYVAPTIPLYDKSTGGKRLIEIFRMLSEEGIAVTFLYQQIGTFTDPQRYLSLLDEIGITHAIDPLGYLSDEARRTPFTLCVIGWYSLAASILPAIRSLLPHTRVAIDSVDIHWAREQTARDTKVSTLSEDEFQREKLREIKVYREADEVWVVSGAEADILHRELPSTKTRVIGVPVSREPYYIESLRGEYVLFLGGFNHPPNISAAIWAADIITEYNRNHSKPLRLVIAGADPPLEVLSLAQLPGVEVLGYVSSLDSIYSKASVFLAPLRSGGGVKGKICEAIGYGVPVITNALGNEGLGLKDSVEILLAESTGDFEKRLEELFLDQIDLESLRVRALDALLQRYGKEVVKRQLVRSVVAPRVVIAIVTYNKKELVKSCVYSVLQKTSYPNFTIAIVSNACSDGTLEFLRDLEMQYPGRITVYPSEVNHFFVRPNNYIIEHSADADIVLMNNDVEVVNPGWLSNLVDAAYSDSDVCGAGGLVLDENGLVSEAGAEIYPSGLGKNLFRGSKPTSPALSSIGAVGFVSGCLMYMRRDAIQRIGPLDDDFHPMYYEDAAWHYKAHRIGLKTIYTPWCIVVHKEGSTAGTDTSKGMKRYQEINRGKFLAKFAEHELSGEG